MLAWGLLFLQLCSAVLGAWDIHGIMGCAYNYNGSSFGLTMGCRPAGGQTITILGRFDQPDVRQITVRFYQAGAAATSAMQCSSLARPSATRLTCTTPPGTGLLWLPEIIDLQHSLVAVMSGPANVPNASLSYRQGGLGVLEEGVGIFVGFMSTLVAGPATFRSGAAYLQGLTTKSTAGTLDSNVWRVQGLNGKPTDPWCYLEGQSPSSAGLRVGDCGTFWGVGTDVYAKDGSVYSVNTNNRNVISGITDSTTSQTFSSLSTFPGFTNMNGGVASFLVGTERGGLGFVPFARTGGKNDLSPGALDLRLVNRMAQNVTGVSVRYSLQCRNTFNASTTVLLQYATEGADDAPFRTVPNTAFTTPGYCDTTCGLQPTCAASTCWTSNKFVDAEITGLVWPANQELFLRWYVDSTAAPDTFSDPCRIADIEVTPYVLEAQDKSLKITAVDRAYVDLRKKVSYTVTSSVSRLANWTLEMSVHPQTYAFATDTAGMPRQLITANMTLMSSLKNSSSVPAEEWSWIIRGSSPNQNAIALYQNAPPDVAGLLWTSQAIVPRDRWTHVTLQQRLNNSGSYLRIFLNGRVTDEKRLMVISDLGGDDAASTIRLGQRAGVASTDPFIGLIDEVRLWTSARSDDEIMFNQGNKGVSGPSLLVHLPLDSYEPVERSTPNLIDSAPVALIEKAGSEAPLSTISASTLLTFTGGTVLCPEKYTIPGGRVTCHFAIMDQFGRNVSVYDRRQFRVNLTSGCGTIGPLDPEYGGAVWRFTYFAIRDVHGAPCTPGTAEIQAFDKTFDPLVGNPATISVIPEGCRGCEYRHSIEGAKIYSCSVGGRRFMRREIHNVEGMCPMA